MAAYITVGAKTTHGGTVISGSPHTTHNGIPIARVGDKVMCKKCKKITTIVSGDAAFVIDGAPIARAGDTTSCGAKLVAVQQSFAESDFEVMGIEEAEKIKQEAQSYANKVMSKYNKAFQFLSDDNIPYANFDYTAINKQSGENYHGVTDENGWTERFYSDSDDEIEVKLDLEWQKGLGVFE